MIKWSKSPCKCHKTEDQMAIFEQPASQNRSRTGSEWQNWQQMPQKWGSKTRSPSIEGRRPEQVIIVQDGTTLKRIQTVYSWIFIWKSWFVAAHHTHAEAVWNVWEKVQQRLFSNKAQSLPQKPRFAQIFFTSDKTENPLKPPMFTYADCYALQRRG